LVHLLILAGSKMAETVFTPSLEGMKHVKAENGVILTKPFLEVGKQILPVLGNSICLCRPFNPLLLSAALLLHEVLRFRPVAVAALLIESVIWYGAQFGGGAEQ